MALLRHLELGPGEFAEVAVAGAVDEQVAAEGFVVAGPDIESRDLLGSRRSGRSSSAS